MLNNFVNFELLFTKLLGLDPYEKCILNNQVGMLGNMFLWLIANLKQGVIYFIKQALPPNISAGSVLFYKKQIPARILCNDFGCMNLHPGIEQSWAYS